MANRQNTFLLKRSNVPGKVPLSGDLKLGEIAINTADAILYASGTTANSILPIGWDRINRTGDTVTGNFIFNGGITANTISATTYLNLPPFVGNYLPLSGGTVYGNTVFSSGLSANTLFVSGLTETSGITSTGGIIFPQKTISSTYSAQTEDYTIDASGGTFTIYLPTAVGVQGKLYNIKNNGGGAITVQPYGSETIDDKPFVILGETNALQLVSNGFDWVALGYNVSTVNSSTGVFEFTGITTASTTTFYVSPVKGWIVDDTTNPLSPQIYYISYSGGIHTDNYVNTDTETFVFLNSGGTISQQPTALTEQQRRQNIFLGKISHPDKAAINFVLNQPDYVLSPLGQLRDMFVPINLINGGILPSPNGANLKFNTSAGYLYGLGINFTNNTLAPNAIYVSGASPRTFQYRTQTGATLTDITDIDPTKYDVGGIVTPITGTKATNQRIYLLQNGSVRVMYGQQTYNTLALAVEALQSESFISFPNFSSDAVLIGILSVLSTATDLTDTSKAKFFFASKFGETIGAAGGTSTTTLQQAYNNSTSPEITTNSILDGVQFKGGTGNDNDKNIIIESNAGTQTAWITASGDSRFRSANLNYIDFNTGATVTQSQGRVSWDSGTGTLNVTIGDAGTGLLDLQVGQEEMVRVFNAELTTLQKGEIVYVSGSQGNRPRVKRASAVGDGYSVTTLGMVDSAIPSGSEGYVTTFGIISNINTSGYTGGTPVWLSPTTPGGWTSVKPKAPDHTVLIGYIVRVSPTVGSIFVNISNGWELDELHDVRISGATSGDLLVRSSYSGTPVWINSKLLNGNYTISGNTSHIGDFSVTGTVNTDTVQFDTSFTGATSVGELSWNQSEGTLNIKMGGGNVTQQVGQEQYYQVINKTISTGITNGSVVSAAGVDIVTGKINGAYMIADGSIPYFYTLGIATEAIASGNTGLVTNFGIVRDIDTTGAPYGETWLQGDILYASPIIPGGLTNIEPDTPDLKIQIALVLKVGALDGSLFVRPSLGFDLSNLHNVKNSGSEADGDLLFYSASTTSWVYGKQLTGNYQINGSLTATTFYGNGANLTGLTAYWTSGSTGLDSIKAINSSGLDATGDRAVAINNGTIAYGNDSFAQGQLTIASGISSHAEGSGTTAIGVASHAEGYGTIANGGSSHAEGHYTTSFGKNSHAEGASTTAGLLGYQTIASGVTNGVITLDSAYGDVTSQFVYGYILLNDSNYDAIYGTQKYSLSATTFSGGSTILYLYDTTINTTTAIIGTGDAMPINADKTFGDNSHTEGANTTTIGLYSHTEGRDTTAIGNASHAEGQNTTAGGTASHAEGQNTTASGTASHAEGELTTASGLASHAEGGGTIATGDFSHAEGKNTTASGLYSHAEGVNTIAQADYSHTEGRNTTASNDYSHSEGFDTTSLGIASHSQGFQTTAISDYSFASGSGSTASGLTSFIHSSNSIAAGNRSAVLGGQNITGLTDDTVYVPNFNINYTPSTDNTVDSFLVRDNSGDIKIRDFNSIDVIPNVVTVSLTGGTADFTSIKAACDSITGATSANTYTVRVYAGVYYENQFTIPSWVSVVGDSSVSTIIEANNSSQTLIYLSDQSAIFDCQVQGCTGSGVAAIVYSSSTTPQSSAISYIENVRFGANYTHAKVVAYGGANIIMQCSNVKYGGYPFTIGFEATRNASGIGRMQLRNVTSTNGGITTTTGLIFAKAIQPNCGFIVNGCLLTKAAGAAAGTGFYVENGGFLRLTGVNFQRWDTGIYVPQVGSAPSIDAIALNFENCTTDVNIIHSGTTGKIQGTDNFLKTKININAPIYEVNTDAREIIVAKKGGDFSSIKSAVDYLAASANTSSSNRYVISVGPGEFTEGEIDLTNTPYVSIVGSNIQTTLIKPSGNTQNIINIGINNEISFLTLSGAASGYAGIYCYDIGDFGQAHKISFYDCDTNIWVESDTQDTKFYGEYLDFNGDYTYGTKVIGNNGYVALANMENYYNFPVGTGITYCNYATGSGATISTFVGDNVSNGVSGSTAYYIQDAAELNASTITVDGFTYGIRNPNVGATIRFDIDNASLVNGQWDLFVERSGTFGTFGGSSNHQKIYTISTDIYWSFLDIDDGELDITRKASVTFDDGTHTDFTTLLFEGSTMGLMSGGELLIYTGLTIDVKNGYGYLAKSAAPNIIMRIDWGNSTFTLGANENKYIYINENSIISSSGSKPDSVNNIILGRVVTNSSTVSFIDLSPVNSDHTSNKYDSLFTQAMGPIYANGSIVTEGSTPFTINATSGEYYYSTNQYLPAGGSGFTFTQYYRDGSGGWITSATTLVNNTDYDGNGSLSALTTSYYTKHTLYLVGEATNENYFLVLGQNEYSTLVQAEGASLPTPPTFFSDSVVQIANIYIQEGATGFTQVEDIRPTIAFKAGGVNASSIHGNLLGLAADDHTQYLLVNGGRAMSGNLDMGNNNIVSAGTINGVTIESHATRHQFGGADQVGSVTPGPNYIPYADVSGKLDSWVSTGSTSTLGRVKLSAAPTLASNPIAVGTNDVGYLNSYTGATYSANTLSLKSVNNTTDSVTIGLKQKAGTVAGASFAGNPKKYTVTFTTAYPNTNYSIQITGAVNRSFTYESKLTTGFVINTNSNTSFTENVDWLTIATGES